MPTHWEPLGRDLRVLVNETHRFNTDTLLLADFSLPRPGWRCADLGTGCGVIPLLWCARGRPASVLAVELQPEAVRLAEDSASENSLAEIITVQQGDLRDYKNCLPHQALDLAACNPPYFSPGSGLIPQEAERGLARHGGTLSLAELAQAARYSLKTGGRLCLCLPARRLAEAVVVLHQHELEPKRLRLVQARPEKAPYLFLMECRRGGGPGLEVETPLVLETEAGDLSAEMVRIYGDYLEGGGANA